MAFLTINLVILSLAHTLCYCQNVFTVNRESPKDIFKVPSFNCSDSGAPCSIYHRSAFSTGDRCKCSCPHSASIFGFFRSSWRCMGNQALRTQFGCKRKFPLEQDNSPLKVLKDDGIQNTYVELTGNKCNIDYTKSLYLMCDETMMKLSERPDHRNIIIAFQSRTDTSNNHKYYISIKKGTSLKGGLVSLYFDCASSCLLFKIAGETSCSIESRNTVKNNVITKMPTTIDSQAASTGIFAIKPSLTTTTDSQGSTGELSSGVVAVVVLLVILFIITGVIIGYLFWKRKRGERVWLLDQCLHIGRKFRSPLPSRKKEEDKRKCENPIYEEIEDITFVEGRTTIPDKGISLTLMSSESSPRETQDTSLRQGRRSITDAEGYAVPVELQEHQRSVADRGLAQNKSHENISPNDRYGYTIPEGEYDKLKEPDYGGPNEEAISGQHLETDRDLYDIPETHLSEEIEQMHQQTSDGEMEATNQSESQRTFSNIEQKNSQSPEGTHQNQLKKVRRRPPSPPRK